eukprot:3288343-Prymnesium_polylepis.1
MRRDLALAAASCGYARLLPGPRCTPRLSRARTPRPRTRRPSPSFVSRNNGSQSSRCHTAARLARLPHTADVQ